MRANRSDPKSKSCIVPVTRRRFPGGRLARNSASIASDGSRPVHAIPSRAIGRRTRPVPQPSSSIKSFQGGALNQAFKRFKEIADKKKQVTALDLEAIVSDEMRESPEAYNLGWFEVEAGSERPPKARVCVSCPAARSRSPRHRATVRSTRSSAPSARRPEPTPSSAL